MSKIRRADKAARIFTVIGTRPEAIKLAPVILASMRAGLEPIVYLRGQHSDMVKPVLDIFGIVPQVDHGLRPVSPALSHLLAALVAGAHDALISTAPDFVVVQGDTTSALSAAIAAFHLGIAVAHVEAGLRTNDLSAPWPEEGNRQMIARLAQQHFAPSAAARDNLISEGIRNRDIHVTGNTVIDALQFVRDTVLPGEADVIARQFPWLASEKRLVLVTGHRRENHGDGLENVCRALSRLAERNDCQIVYPVHPNPAVDGTATALLAGVDGVFLIPHQPYLSFIWLMARADLIITDSGGVQEEAAALGKPLLITRSVTERTELVTAGMANLVGTDEDTIVRAASRLLDDAQAMKRMAVVYQPYGDGDAAPKIVEAMACWLSRKDGC